jgi:hypothetical protein
MNQIPFRQRPVFRSVVLAVLLAGIYIYSLLRRGGIAQNILGIVFDLIVLALLYQLCIFFYAQFILPADTMDDRRKIASRLNLHAANGHGPAIFVKNGRKVERLGESDKWGPGLLWVDTASAVVTRTFTTFKQVLGPGVHFIEANEKIASIISLHVQTQTIGPTGTDSPFEELKEDATEEEQRQHDEMLARCLSVRAMTRDGIEVIPTINVSFKIDARPSKPGENGSHFGFNPEAVERAARSEGVNPTSISEDKRRVAWNQLPGLMAAELWREYLSKFTLSELFDPSLKPLPEVRQPVKAPRPIVMPQTPLLVKRGFAARLLRNFNNRWEKRLDTLMPPESPPIEEELASSDLAHARKQAAASPRTALQLINQMLKARLSQALVVKLDDCGRLTEGHQISDEYSKLDERGVAVLGASVSALYLDPAVEAQLLARWTTSWLSNARSDRDRIERLDLAYTEQAKHKALLDHTLALSESVIKERPANVAATVGVLLRGTEAEIRANDRMLARVSNELDTLQGLEKWLEDKQP